MISFFTIARSFSGRTDLIQRNAVRSWRNLHHNCEVILVGDDGGSAEVALQYGLIHVPDVVRNEYGSMLVNDVFAKAEACSRHRLLCYVSADVILLPDFLEAAMRMRDLNRPFLMGGRRWDLDVTEELTFEPGWDGRLRSQVAARGHLDSPECVDYFLFTRGLLGEIPPFAIGRKRWDRWIQHRARCGPGLFVDATEVVTAVHQSHDYGALGFLSHKRGPESVRNIELAGDRFCDLRQARLKLTHGGLKPAIDWTRIQWQLNRAMRPLAKSARRLEDSIRATPGLRRVRTLLRASKALRRFFRTGHAARQERIGVIGLQGMGIVLAASFASSGSTVVGVDPDASVLGAVRAGRTPGDNRALERLLKQSKDRLSFHVNVEKAVYKANVIVLAMPTLGSDRVGLTPDRLLAACEPVGAVLAGARRYRLILVVGSVVPGWTENLVRSTLERISGRRMGPDFGLCYCCLSGGDRTLHPDQVVIGESDPGAGRYVARLTAQVWGRSVRVVRTTIVDAELAHVALGPPVRRDGSLTSCAS